MYIKTKNKKIIIKEANTFWERLKGLKFVLGPLTYGVRFPNKKSSNTNFLFERVDVLLTDENEKILFIFKNVGTERKIRRKKGVCNTYFLPVGSVDNFEIGDQLNLIIEKEDEERRKSLLEKKKKNKDVSK